jgi:hypothetical protein
MLDSTMVQFSVNFNFIEVLAASIMRVLKMEAASTSRM